MGTEHISNMAERRRERSTTSMQKHERLSPRGYDLFEVRPQRFVVGDMRMGRLLKREGHLHGTLFELTSWRREGLLARIRSQGFSVATLEDQIAALPSRPPAFPEGETLTYRPPNREQVRWFHPISLGWVMLAPQSHTQGNALSLRLGWVIHRRTGRSGGKYAQVVGCEGEHSERLAMHPMTESDAILAGYAQAIAEGGERDISMVCDDSGQYVPDVLMPDAYRDLLRRLGRRTPDGWHVDRGAWPLVRALYSKLGLLLLDSELPAED